MYIFLPLHHNRAERFNFVKHQRASDGEEEVERILSAGNQYNFSLFFLNPNENNKIRTNTLNSKYNSTHLWPETHIKIICIFTRIGCYEFYGFFSAVVSRVL
jgi:hypothetical protein